MKTKNDIPEPLFSEPADGFVQEAPKRKAKKFKRGLFWILCLLLLMAIIGFAYYFIQYQRLKSDPSVQAREQTQAVINEISKLMLLPNDPNTILAAVTDKDKFKGQSFFAKAQNGDVVVIFPSELLAVLYRPSIKKIVTVSQMSTDLGALGQPAGTSSAQVSTSTVEASSSNDTTQ